MVMGIANSSFCNVILAAATVSSSIILAPEISFPGSIGTWETVTKNKIYPYDPAPIFSDYSFYSSSDELKINSLISFSSKLLMNSKDIESDFVELINKNFWDLL